MRAILQQRVPRWISEILASIFAAVSRELSLDGDFEGF